MKKLVVFIVCFGSLTIYGQEATTEFDGHKWEAPYDLAIPMGWTLERFLIPIAFAPQILYEGVEDIRFTPGWSNIKSEDYWTYAFLWYLNGTVKTSSGIIAENLKAYYTGLININIDTAKLKALPEKLREVKTSFKESQPATGDLKTFTGTITMLDFMQLKPISLNCVVHVRMCNEANKTILFYELSPQPYTHKSWGNLNKLWVDFSCKKH